MTNEEFIDVHRAGDVRKLAFVSVPDGVDLKWCLQQIEGWQIAQKKLPRWVATTGLWYPAKLSMEQCSSEETAKYKAEIVKRILPNADNRAKMVDLTGGYGVDFSYIAPLFRHATYVEKLECLCDIARHNFPLLGLKNAEVDLPHPLPGKGDGIYYSLIYLDPARRDDAGRKTVAIEDCTPNVVEMQDELLEAADFVMIKLSPMLDISEVLRRLKCVREIHVVSVRGECKELVVVIRSPHPSPLPPKREEGVNTTVTCVNLGTDDEPFTVETTTPCPGARIGGEVGKYLYEPNASILKAGVQDVLMTRMPVRKLHPMSNLFTSDELVTEFPGRKFWVEGVCDFSKKSLRELLNNVQKANLTIRNFPGTVDALRKRLKLKEGGEVYLFATTLWDGTHTIIRCSKV